ncbi:hypothetical protein SNEBB_010176 [Seison nebaliae]|nr:hypothetical protein SNEBB_010176 [Seison nebaliae]
MVNGENAPSKSVAVSSNSTESTNNTPISRPITNMLSEQNLLTSTNPLEVGSVVGSNETSSDSGTVVASIMNVPPMIPSSATSIPQPRLLMNNNNNLLLQQQQHQNMNGGRMMSNVYVPRFISCAPNGQFMLQPRYLTRPRQFTPTMLHPNTRPGQPSSQTNQMPPMMSPMPYPMAYPTSNNPFTQFPTAIPQQQTMPPQMTQGQPSPQFMAHSPNSPPSTLTSLINHSMIRMKPEHYGCPTIYPQMRPPITGNAMNGMIPSQSSSNVNRPIGKKSNNVVRGPPAMIPYYPTINNNNNMFNVPHRKLIQSVPNPIKNHQMNIPRQVGPRPPPHQSHHPKHFNNSTINPPMHNLHNPHMKHHNVNSHNHHHHNEPNFGLDYFTDELEMDFGEKRRHQSSVRYLRNYHSSIKLFDIVPSERIFHDTTNLRVENQEPFHFTPKYLDELKERRVKLEGDLKKMDESLKKCKSNKRMSFDKHRQFHNRFKGKLKCLMNQRELIQKNLRSLARHKRLKRSSLEKLEIKRPRLSTIENEIDPVVQQMLGSIVERVVSLSVN